MKTFPLCIKINAKKKRFHEDCVFSFCKQIVNQGEIFSLSLFRTQIIQQDISQPMKSSKSKFIIVWLYMPYTTFYWRVFTK
ncbi:hypothetical protein COI59_19880 [Bacillus toyonensis]|nr:hypothetical protein COI59_19880 [Bacillus toyonensis]